MMKYLSLFFATLITSNYSLAQPAYGKVPNAEERQADEAYVRFPGFETINFVRDGYVDKDLTSMLDQSQWKGDVDLYAMKWLQLRALDIRPALAKKGRSSILIPFAASIRFQESGGVAEMLGQGTIDSKGNIIIGLDGDQVTGVEVTVFDDSQQAESIERKLKAIDQYDGFFVAGLIEPTLTEYFSEADHLEELVDMLDAGLISMP